MAVVKTQDRVQMVALGISFASGPGIPPYSDRNSGRSRRNYARIVAEAIGADLSDTTIGGATTTTILTDCQRLRRRTYRPQIESVGPETDLVTITAGGNDLGYIPFVTNAAIADVLERNPLTRPTARRLRGSLKIPDETAIRQASDGLVAVVEAIHARAPRARVLLIDYLPLLSPSSTGRMHPRRPADREAVVTIAALLSAAMEQAASRTGAHLLPARALGFEHTIGSADPWVNGLTVWPGGGAAFHPTASGMAGVAAHVVAALRDNPLR